MINRKEKSEKRIQAEALILELPSVTFTEMENPSIPYFHKMNFCFVNNSIYLQASSVTNLSGGSYFRYKSDSGEIEHNGAIPVLMNGAKRVIWIVAMEVVKQFSKEIGSSYNYNRYPLLDCLADIESYAKEHKEDIAHYSFDDGAIDRMHSIYRQYLELIAQDKRELTDLMAQQVINNESEMKHSQNNNYNLTLNELVARIEAMGWEVTLKRKDNSPEWHDEETDKLLMTCLDNTCLSNGIVKKLAEVGVKTIGSLAQMSKMQLLEIPMFGRKKLSEVEDFLESMGLRFQGQT